MSRDLPPPPTYASAVGLSENTTDPLLRQGEGQDSQHGTPSNMPESGSHQHFIVPESPHSSDDEETVRLKADLRKLRNEKFRIRSDSNRQEQKKQWLKEALEREERDLRAATGYGPVQPAYGSMVPNPTGACAPTAPPYGLSTQYVGPNSQSQRGIVYHPAVSYTANTASGYPSPSSSVQIGQTPQNPNAHVPAADDRPPCSTRAAIGFIFGMVAFLLFMMIIASQ